MIVDLRRFDYGFEPLLRQRQWSLDALEARLGRITGEIHAATRELGELRERFHAEGQSAARAMAERLDPVNHPHTVKWLQRLRLEITAAEQRLAALRVQRSEVVALCAAQRQKVEVIEQHREECRMEFIRDEEGRLSREADGDWLSRRQWERSRANPLPEEPR